MKKLKRTKMFNFAFIAAIGIFALATTQVSADTVVNSYTFEGNVPAIGGRERFLELLGDYADYLKVNITAKNGDTYDLSYITTASVPSHSMVLGEKATISAKGSTNTFYFIPQNGSCPTSNSSHCIKIAAATGYSTVNEVASNSDILYGIEVHNGSLFGGTLNVSGTYTFMNY